MPEDLVLPTLRGGFNDAPPHTLDDDQCVVAENVEWFHSTLGERRKGCETFDITGSGLESEDEIVFIKQWFPTNDASLPELWVVGATVDTSITVARRDTLGVWHTVIPTHAPVKTSPEIYQWQAQPLNGKLFFAYASAHDRLHVWDGTTLRPTGLAQPAAAPVVANEGVGTYTETRYFRVRFIKKTGSVIDLRSEPSDTTTFIPSGTGAGAQISRPALLGEGETHWEVEASIDDADYYVIAEVIIATTTYNDETDLATTDYADLGDLSEDIGEYLTQPSAKFLGIDEDRLVGASHYTEDSQKSQVWWTPVQNDPGSGNDERTPLGLNNSVILDSTEGGSCTGLGRSANGTYYVFKWSRLYKMARTGSAIRAYKSVTISEFNGAIEGSLIQGRDEKGRSCTYYLDPFAGPARLGSFGPEAILGLQNTWDRVNATATIKAHGVYYPSKKQIHWWVSVDGSDTPNLKFVLQVNELKSTEAGAYRGWSVVNGHLAEALCSGILNETVLNEDGDLQLISRPLAGFSAPDLLQRCDTGDTDNGTAFVAKIRTKPLITAGLLNRWGAMTASLLATANANASIRVRFIRDFSIDTLSATRSLAPVGTEDYVIVPFDELHMSETKAMQIEFSDSTFNVFVE